MTAFIGAGMVVPVVELEDKSRVWDMELDSPYVCRCNSWARKSGPTVARRNFAWSAERRVFCRSSAVDWRSGDSGGCGEIRRCNWLFEMSVPRSPRGDNRRGAVGELRCW